MKTFPSEQISTLKMIQEFALGRNIGWELIILLIPFLHRQGASLGVQSRTTMCISTAEKHLCTYEIFVLNWLKSTANV